LYVRVRNLLRLREYSNFLVNHNRILDEQVRTRTAQLTESYRETIHSLNRAAAYRDEQTGSHVVRIGYYCTALAEALGMDAGFRDCIFYASPMHDLGKIGIPDHILFKSGGFTPEEWEIMKTHAELGARMLERGESPYIRMGRDIALSHHERWDGTGYPHGLRGEQIPLSARIMQLTDVYDALRSRRPYKPPFTHERSLEIILKGDGRTQPGHFDPEVLLAFRGMTARFQEIYEVQPDETARDATVAA
jgi:putative two-component system response regulator